MVLLLGFHIHESKIVRQALQKFYGIGPDVSARICAQFSIHQTAKLGSLPPPKLNALNDHLAKMPIENDLRRKMQDNIKRLRDMGSYRGKRHAWGYPVRGQRTRSQIATARKLNRVERRA